MQALAFGLLLNRGSLYQREDAKCSQARGSGGGQSRFLCLVHSGDRGADEVLGKALTCFLHSAPCPLESLQNIVDRALLAEASKPVQYTLHAMPRGTGFQKGFRLLQAVKPERDIPCCLCAKTKAAQTLSLEGCWYPDIGHVL